MKQKMSLTNKIFTGLILGMIAGLILHPMRDNLIVKKYLLDFSFNLLGSGFIRAIRMVVVPLIFFSLTVGAAGIEDIKKLGRVGVKTVGFYLMTTAVAITLAIGAANITNPGIGFNLASQKVEAVNIAESKPFVNILLDMIPINPIEAMVKGDMLAIIFFSIMFGVAMAILGKKAAGVRKIFEEGNDIVLKIVELIMLVAPFGVFGLVAKTFTTIGYSAFLPLMKYFMTVLAVLLIHLFLVYMGMLVFFGKYNPIQFFKKFIPTMVVAFSTSSSNATIPANLKTMQEKFGVSKSISSFTIPLGATINMDGTAIMQGVATVFIAQVYGIDLTLGNYVTVVVTATLASIGTAGVPGVGLIMLGMVLTQLGLPLEGIALIMGVDRLLDMVRTVVNITGDAVCTLIIARSEKEEFIYEEDVDGELADVE
ncbi:MAG: dicarboxylate/amino acid:cation symporter [Fusobacteriaceae bacterium]